MSAPTTTRQWLVNASPTGLPILTGPSPTFKLASSPVPSLADNQVLLRTVYLSNDPAMRGWIDKTKDPKRMYTTIVEEGMIMRAGALCKVIESKAEGLNPGMMVHYTAGWTEYAVADGNDCRPIQEIPNVPITAFLGGLGTTGLTAYYGMVEIARATADDTVVVSGAAGATGSMAVQIAKRMLGCKRVVGIAGSDSKCKWVESIGADVCVNYKSPSFKKDLDAAIPDYATVYFDNVGGSILNLMLSRVARYGRIAACGSIASYNDNNQSQMPNWWEVVGNRLEIKGFIVTDYYDKRAEAFEALVGALKEGKITITEENEEVVESGFDGVPGVWMRLFEGSNTGKLLTKLV